MSVVLCQKVFLAWGAVPCLDLGTANISRDIIVCHNLASNDRPCTCTVIFESRNQFDGYQQSLQSPVREMLEFLQAQYLAFPYVSINLCVHINTTGHNRVGKWISDQRENDDDDNQGTKSTKGKRSFNTHKFHTVHRSSDHAITRTRPTERQQRWMVE